MKETTMTAKHSAKQPKAAASTTAQSDRMPTHRLYRVLGDGDSANWTPIGAAWPHKDGKGLSITCDAVPLTGRIVLRRIEPREQSAGGQQ
jgi:hypothetical protein